MSDDTDRKARRRANLARVLKAESLLFMGSSRFIAPAIETCRSAGYTGKIMAVSRSKAEISGVPCLPSIEELDRVPDAALLGVPAEDTIDIVRRLSEMGAAGAVCFASGFGEFGDVGKAREAALVEAAGDMAIIGPNCFGVINYATHASLWPVGYQPDAGPKGAAVIAQSGNVCINMSMNQRDVPFSYIISAGNQAMLSFADYVDCLVDDPNVTAIGLFLEGIPDIPAFSDACIRAQEKGLPVIAFRVGVSDLGAKLAATHTSSLAGQNELYDALFKRLGVMQTASVPQFLELLKIASLGRRPKGGRLAVFSSSGGDNGMAADFTSGGCLELPPLSGKQVAALKPCFPDFAHIGNPFDFSSQYWGDEEGLYPMMVDVLSEGFDQGMLVVDHPRLELGEGQIRAMAAMVSAMGRACRETGVSGVVCSVNPESMPDIMRRQVIELGMTPLQGLHDGGPVLGMWTAHCLKDAGAQESPLPPFAAKPYDGASFAILDEHESKRRLAEAGVKAPKSRTGTIDAVVAAVKDGTLRAPYALKALHEELLHKTDAGAVALELWDEGDLRAAAADIIDAVAAYDPLVEVEAFLLEEMAPEPVTELMLGVQRDPQFGFVMVLAAGGVTVELMQDAAQMLLPVTRAEVETALRSLKAFPLLDGFRGRPKADVEAVVDAVMAVAGYVENNLDTLVSMDVNPLMVYPEGSGVLAVDALVMETG